MADSSGLRRFVLGLTLQLLALAVWLCSPAPAHAHGSSGGATRSYQCTYNIATGYPGAKPACAATIAELVDADFAKKLADYYAQFPTYNYAYRGDYVSPYSLAAVEGGICRYTYKYNKADGSVNSVIQLCVSYAKETRTGVECEGIGYKKVGQLCFCAPGYAPTGQNGACAPSPCPGAGTKVPGTDGQTYISSDINSASYMGCLGGCLVSGAFGAQQQSTPPQHFIMGPLVHTGQQCNPSNEGGTYPGLTGDNKTPSCPPPKCPGTVNGTSVCVACDVTTTGGMSKPNDGQNSGGTDTTTSCQGGVCTTTTKDVGADGSAGPSKGSNTGTGGSNPNANGTGTGGDGNCTGSDCSDQPGFCEENPEAIICKESTWSGTCEGQFSCDGDEIQCSIAKEQHMRNCELFDNETDFSQKGRAGANGIAQPDGHPFKDATQTSIQFSEQLDMTNRLGGSCPAGRSVSVMGASVVLVSDDLCSTFNALGNILVAVGGLLSIFIVFRS